MIHLSSLLERYTAYPIDHGMALSVLSHGTQIPPGVAIALTVLFCSRPGTGRI